MRTTTQRADELIKRHSELCNGSIEKFLSGVMYVPEYSYELVEGETVFNQDFHDLMLRLGIIDSLQSPEQRAALGQAYIIPTKELLKYCTKKHKD